MQKKVYRVHWFADNRISLIAILIVSYAILLGAFWGGFGNSDLVLGMMLAGIVLWGASWFIQDKTLASRASRHSPLTAGRFLELFEAYDSIRWIYVDVARSRYYAVVRSGGLYTVPVTHDAFRKLSSMRKHAGSIGTMRSLLAKTSYVMSLSGEKIYTGEWEVKHCRATGRVQAECLLFVAEGVALRIDPASCDGDSRLTELVDRIKYAGYHLRVDAMTNLVYLCRPLIAIPEYD